MFEVILNYFRTHTTPGDVNQYELLEEATFFGLKNLCESLKFSLKQLESSELENNNGKKRKAGCFLVADAEDVESKAKSEGKHIIILRYSHFSGKKKEFIHQLSMCTRSTDKEFIMMFLDESEFGYRLNSKKSLSFSSKADISTIVLKAPDFKPSFYTKDHSDVKICRFDNLLTEK